MSGSVQDVVYDYYVDDDPQVAVALSIFSLIMAGLAWLREVTTTIFSSLLTRSISFTLPDYHLTCCYRSNQFGNPQHQLKSIFIKEIVRTK